MNICLYEHLIQTVVLNILIHLSQDVCGGTVLFYTSLIGLQGSLSHLLAGEPSFLCFNGRGQHILRCVLCHRPAVAE